jgi:Type IV secretion system pilin
MRLTHPHTTHTTDTRQPARPATTRSTSPAARRRAARSVTVPALTTAGVAAVLLLLSAAPAVAADGGRVLALAGSVDEVLNNLRNWLMGILAGVATVFLTIGGFRRILAGGDPGELEKSRQAFRNSALGFALAALAPLVVTILRGLVGA